MNRLIKLLSIVVLASFSLASHAGILYHGIAVSDLNAEPDAIAAEIGDGGGTDFDVTDFEYNVADIGDVADISLTLEDSSTWNWIIEAGVTTTLSVVGALYVDYDEGAYSADDASLSGEEAIADFYAIVADGFGLATSSLDFDPGFAAEDGVAILLKEIVIDVVAGFTYEVSFSAFEDGPALGSLWAEFGTDENDNPLYTSFSGGTGSVYPSSVDVPEPGTLGLLLLGLGALVLRRRAA